MNLYAEGQLANVSVEADKSKELIRFLDTGWFLLSVFCFIFPLLCA